VIAFVDENRHRTTCGLRWGVEPICTVLQVAPSTYYAAKKRSPSARAQRDADLCPVIQKAYDDNYRVYGARKIWKELNRKGTRVARCTVARLMRSLGIRGVVRGKKVWTTIGDDALDRPADLVERDFSATAPNQLWVADLTYVKTHTGWVYVAFILDVYARYIVGWHAARSLHTNLALTALEMALWKRPGALDGLVHHSDRGVQYLAIRYSDRLDEAGIAASVGSKGDSYDNAMAESLNGLYKTELIERHGPWRGLGDIEHATLDWVDWYNHRRLHGELGLIPPVEYELMNHPMNYPLSTPAREAMTH